MTVSRKFRQLAADKVILPQLLLKESDKRSFYLKDNLAVIPFVLSAQGAVAPAARALIDIVAAQHSPSSVPEQVTFRSHLMHRLSIILIQHACRMGANRVSLTHMG